jgi:hypothetical protein
MKPYPSALSGIVRIINLSNSGTVNSVSPYLGLWIMPLFITLDLIGATDSKFGAKCAAQIGFEHGLSCGEGTGGQDSTALRLPKPE